MKVLILGKNGQVGRCLQECAEKQDINYIALSREDCDISDQSKVEAYFNKQHDFDFVINAAAYTAVDKAEEEIDEAYAANYLAVEYLAKICKKYDIPLIHISTDYVFDGTKETLYTEDDSPNPVSVYGKSKLMGEKALQSIWHKHIILRVSWVFSSYGKNFVKTISRLAKERESLSVVADQYGSPTSAVSISEVLLAICQAQLEHPNADSRWGLYHYTDFPLTTWHQLAKAVVSNLKVNTIIQPIKSSDYTTAAHRPHFSGLDTARVQQVFGINQRCWINKLMKREIKT